MGFNLSKAREKKEEIIKSFTPLELNEGNVQAIFNRCLATKESQEISGGILFPPSHGYKEDAERMIRFDSEILLKNKKTIEYLLGQLEKVHSSKAGKRITIDDYNMTYNGKNWTRDKATMLQFLYLGVTKDTLLISPFRAEDSTSIISPQVKPTLSPKDPNFPAWWEEHKSEWEELKKEGKELSDD